MSIFQPDATLGFSPLSQCIALYVMFGLCGANSLMVSRFARHIVGTIDRIYIFVFCFVSQAVLITTVLGVLGHLNYYLIVASLAAIFVFLRYVHSRLRMRRRSLARSSGMKPDRFPAPFLRTPWTVLLGLAVLVLAVFLFVWAVVTPPPASDAFIYHLTLPVKWMQTGSIAPDRFGPFGESFHPSNPETLLLWLILPFHEDTFANLISWAFWFLCGLAVYSISVALRARHSDGVAAGMLWLALPLAARSAASSEVDLFAAFFFLVSVVFLLRYRSERHVVFLLWGGLSLGIYTGSKLIAFPFSLPVYALYAILVMERRRKRANHLAVFLMSSLLLSGFWYLSNFMLTGNPIHPVEISVFGHVIAPGEIHREAIISSAAHTPRLVELLRVLDEMFGVYLTHVLILTLAAAIFYAVWRRRFMTSGVLLLPVALTVLFWLIGINKINSARYLLPSAALACVGWSIVARERKSIRLPLYFITLACVAMTLAGNRFLIYTVFRNLLHALAGNGGMEAIVSPARWLFL
ncbi:MAG: hypothetical protein ABIH66_08335, partial [bacterium]